MKTKTLTEMILGIVKTNSKNGVTVPQLVTKLQAKSGAPIDRQTVSSRVSALFNTYQLNTLSRRFNSATGRFTTVYVPRGF